MLLYFPISNNLKPLVLLGPVTTCWSLWLSKCYYFLKEEFCFSCAAYILINYPLALYLVHSQEAGFAGFGSGSISTIGIGGQGYFFLLVTWVTI